MKLKVKETQLQVARHIMKNLDNMLDTQKLRYLAAHACHQKYKIAKMK